VIVRVAQFLLPPLLALFFFAAPAPAANTSPAVTAKLVAELVRDLTSAREVTVEHVVSRAEPVRFYTRRPCSRMVEVARFRGAPGADWIAAFLNAVQAAAIDTLTRLPTRICWADTTRTDQLTLVFGRGRHAVRAAPTFADLSVHYMNEKLRVTTTFESHAAAVRELIQRALPGDSLVESMPSCIPVDDSLFDETDLTPGTGLPPDELPETVHKEKPRFPEFARQTDVEGTVSIEALVTKEGLVARTRIFRSVPELDEEAVRAVEEWTFKPARRNGVPVAVWVMVPISFTLE